MSSTEITTLACVTAICVALLLALSMVASCTRDVAKTAAQVELACAQRGLVYFEGLGPGSPGFCAEPKR